MFTSPICSSIGCNSLPWHRQILPTASSSLMELANSTRSLVLHSLLRRECSSPACSHTLLHTASRCLHVPQRRAPNCPSPHCTVVPLIAHPTSPCNTSPTSRDPAHPFVWHYHPAANSKCVCTIITSFLCKLDAEQDSAIPVDASS